MDPPKGQEAFAGEPLPLNSVQPKMKAIDKDCIFQNATQVIFQASVQTVSYQGLLAYTKLLQYISGQTVGQHLK